MNVKNLIFLIQKKKLNKKNKKIIIQFQVNKHTNNVSLYVIFGGTQTQMLIFVPN